MPSARCGFDGIPGGAPGRALLTRYGPTIFVDIGFDEDFRPVLGAGVPRPGVAGVQALVDTGASLSCIDSVLAAELGLPVVDRQKIGGAGGEHEVNMHLAQIHVASLEFTIYGEFAGVHLAAGGQPHRALLGRTFLQRFVMVYEGHTGTVTISTPTAAAPARGQTPQA